MTGRVPGGVKRERNIWNMVKVGTTGVFETVNMKLIHENFDQKRESDLRKNEINRYKR